MYMLSMKIGAVLVLYSFETPLQPVITVFMTLNKAVLIRLHKLCEPPS